MAKLFIQAWAKAKGTNLSRIATDINIAQPSLSLIVNGKSWPKEDTLDKIAASLQVEVYQLFIDPASFEGKKASGICPHCGKPIDVCLVAPE